MCMCKKWDGKIHIKLPTFRKGILFNCYRLLSFEQHYFSDLQGDSSNETYTNNFIYLCVSA